jgi:hypothetical protein
VAVEAVEAAARPAPAAARRRAVAGRQAVGHPAVVRAAAAVSQAFRPAPVPAAVAVAAAALAADLPAVVAAAVARPAAARAPVAAVAAVGLPAEAVAAARPAVADNTARLTAETDPRAIGLQSIGPRRASGGRAALPTRGAGQPRTIGGGTAGR